MIKKILPYSTLALALTAASGASVAASDDQYKATDKPLEMTIHMHVGNKYAWDEEWPVAKEYEKYTGIKLKGVASKIGTNSQELFNLMLVSGNLPDFVGGNALKDSFFQYGMEGAFLPLNDLIEQYAPNIKAFFEQYPDKKKAITAPDGNIYHIAYFPDGQAARAYYIRQDWLDKLGLEQPQTVDELYTVLKAFRDQDPNGNGKKDEVPAFFRHWEEMIRLVTLWDARTTGMDSAHQFYIKDKTTAQHGYVEENYRTGIRNLAKWYKEGLIDQEVFTRGSKARDYLLSNNLGGMTHDWFASTAGYNDSLKDRVPGFEWIPMAPPATPSGVRIEENGRATVKPDGWALTYSNRDPIASIKYMDFIFTEKGRNIANFGVEGVHWTMVDGKATYTDEVLNADTAVNTQMRNVGAQIPLGYPQDYNYEKQWTNEIAAKGIEMYTDNNYIIEQFNGVAMTVAERLVYDKYWPGILTYMLEAQQRWILGSADVDEEWDGYIARINKLGYDKVIKVYQAAYDRQYK
ncbi:extracellular solute-binding protein [Marinomonas sp. C2222]|uniref:Extracellular solute-binding protein n=1 Tax=Marinomonas sargassi TaxID=2984494 RepID=A0ABT2YVT5_9GAMM|nr:extracellular solute-binding protein [Marinomonas sargassi]MCV2404001.1 extracellular solute-binding protein [Marinomonas sargassi]